MCQVQGHPDVKVSGGLTLEAASLEIEDSKNYLKIRELTSDRAVQMARSLRKKEDLYKFAKYYSDVNAWQDLEISVPKSLKSKSFKGFLTVYVDNGDAMVPGESNLLLCTID